MEKGVVYRSQEKTEEIRRFRSGRGFYYPRNMVEELQKHGVNMTRQTWSNKEKGKTKFTASELEALSEIFEMPLAETFAFFNG